MRSRSPDVGIGSYPEYMCSPFDAARTVEMLRQLHERHRLLSHKPFQPVNASQAREIVSEGRVRVDFEGGEIIRTRELEQRIRTNLLHEPKPFRRVRGGGTFSEFPYMPTSVSPDVLFPKNGAAAGKSKSKSKSGQSAAAEGEAAASSEAKPASRPASSPPPAAARAPRRRAASEVRPRPSAPALAATSKSSKSSGGKSAAPAKKRPSASDAGDDGSSTFLTQMST